MQPQASVTCLRRLKKGKSFQEGEIMSRTLTIAASAAAMALLASFAATGQSPLTGNPVNNAINTVKNATPVTEITVKNNSGAVIQACYQGDYPPCKAVSGNISLGLSDIHEVPRGTGNVVLINYWKTMNVGTTTGSGWAPVQDCWIHVANAPSFTVTVTGVYGGLKCTSS
jgi:hypothetical protein